MLPARGAHLIGFPKFIHANEQRGQFIFDGTPAGENEFKAMDEKKATWITGRRKYKKLTMVQENGYIAAKRREYESEGIDRLVYIVGERNHARHAKQEHDKKCLNSMKELKGELKLNTAAVERRVESESIVVDKARAAWAARKGRGTQTDGSKQPSIPSNSHIKSGVQPSNKHSASNHNMKSLSGYKNNQLTGMPSEPLRERCYMRFLKEGPNRGDGCFRESQEEENKRIIGRTFERNRRHKIIGNAFSEK